MNEDIMKDISFLIKDNRKVIKSLFPKEILKKNPNIIIEDQERSKREIEQIVPLIEVHLKELIPFIKNLRKYIKDITEETFVCAVYLLLSHAYQDCNSLLTLARKGDYGSFAFIRLMKESIALSDLFVLDFMKNKRKNLDKWFTGEIIDHVLSRDARKEFVKEDGTLNDEIMKKIDTKIYKMESLVIHSSYITMLESVSSFTEDFDYGGRTQYSRTAVGLKNAKVAIDTLNTNLKLVYGHLIGDPNKYKQLDEILIKHQ